MAMTTTTERRKPMLDSEIEDGIYYPSSDGKPMVDNDFQARAMTYIYTRAQGVVRRQG